MPELDVGTIDNILCLRTTALQELQRCPRRFFAEFGQQIERGDYAVYGTFVHLAAERVLTGEVGPNTPAWHGMWSAAPARMPAHEVRAAEGYCHNLWASVYGMNAHLEVKAVEKRFYSQIVSGAPPLTGQIDLLAFDHNTNRWLIIDHKTNRQAESIDAWSSRLQPISYARALRKKLGARANCGIDFQISYALLDHEVRWETDPWLDIEFEQLFRDLWEEIRVYRRTGDMPARINAYCGSCALAKAGTCDVAQFAHQQFAQACYGQEQREASLLEQYAFSQSIGKLVDAKLDDLKEKLRQRLGDDRQLTEAGYVAKLAKPRLHRSVAVGDVEQLAESHEEMRPELLGLIRNTECQPSLTVRPLGLVKKGDK